MVLKGEKSRCKAMISVVPLVSVLGRVLFVLFVNAFPDNITDDSKIYIYVGDKGFRFIKEQDDLSEVAARCARSTLLD